MSTPLSSMFSIPLFLRGERRATSLVTHLDCFIISWYIIPGHWLHTFLRGEEALVSGRFELYHEALGIVSRGSHARTSLFCMVLVFLGTVLWLFLGTALLLFLGTAYLGVTRDG